MFQLFPKDFEIVFKNDCSIIVGENGSGKSTMIHHIKDYIGTPRKKGSFMTDDEHKDFIKRNRENSSIVLDTQKELTYKNCVFFDGEKDNPILSIPKMVNPLDSKTYNPLIAKLIYTQEESHGESMIPILDFILNKLKNTVIFIDEPETALSLPMQLKLAGWLKESVKRGNKLIVSTHSMCIIMQFNEIYDMESRSWVNKDDYLSLYVNNS